MTLQVHDAQPDVAGFTDLSTVLRLRAAGPGSALFAAVGRRGSKAAIVHSSMLDPALRAALHLRDQGVRRSDRVLIATAAPADTWIAYLACTAIGAVPLISPIRGAFDDPTKRDSLVDQLRSLLGPDAWVVGSTRLKESSRSSDRILTVQPGALPPLAAPWLFPTCGPDDIAHFQLTSGSTGEPSLIAITHGSLCANVSAIVDALDVTADDVYVSWLPLYHDLGLVGTCLTALFADANLYLISPFDYLRDPMLWLRTISEVRGTVTCAPDFALRQVARHSGNRSLGDLDLRCLRRLVCGGEPVRATSIRSFSQALATTGFDWRSIAPSYGLAESTVYVATSARPEGARRLVVDRSDLVQHGTVQVVDAGAVLGSEAPTGPRLTEVVAVGPTNGVEFWVGDAQGRRAADRYCGEIMVSGPSVAAGYIGQAGELIQFDSTAFPTGDLGFMHEGELFVVDRLKNSIIRNGESHSAFNAEDAIATALGVDIGHVVVVETDLHEPSCTIAAIIELPDDSCPSRAIEQIASQVDTLPFTIHEVAFAPQRSLPRTTSGKKQHARARQLLRAGQFGRTTLIRPHSSRSAEAGEATPVGGSIIDIERIECQQRVLDLVQEAATQQGCDRTVALSSHLANDLDIDSLAMFELAVRLEQEFDVGFADGELDGIERVHELVLLVETSRLLPDGVKLGELVEHFSKAADAVQLDVDAQNRRQLYIGDRWVTDLASVNYLGFDVDEDIQQSIPALVSRWGTHPSWTRAVASPRPYRDLERRLAALVGAEDTVVFPTITLLHFGVMPRLAGRSGALLIESTAHHSMHEAAELAQARGAEVITWQHGDLQGLERALERCRHHSARIISVVGVNSMSGDIVDLPSIVRIAAAHDAIVYVDDAHGLGLLGGRSSASCPYGSGGGGVLRYHDVTDDRVIYVAGLSKAFSSMAAFVTCGSRFDRQFFMNASTMVFSGPVPTASLATALAGLDANEQRGDVTRHRVHELTQRMIAGLRSGGYNLEGHSGLPIINIEVGSPAAVHEAVRHIWRSGFVVTPSVFPAAPLHRGGLRASPTAANTPEEVDAFVAAVNSLPRSRRPQMLVT